MKVLPLDKSNAYFQVQDSAVQWWTACLTKDGWYIVNMFGREVKPDGKRGSEIVRAVENERKMAAVRKCLGG